MLGVILAIAASVKLLKKEINPITLSFLGYTIFSICLAYSIDDPWGTLRILNGLFVMALLAFIINKKEKAVPMALYFSSVSFIMFIRWNIRGG